MFICDRCQNPSRPREKVNKRVAEVRTKEYRHKGGTSTGHETVREEKICNGCATIEKVTGSTTDAVGAPA